MILIYSVVVLVALYVLSTICATSRLGDRGVFRTSYAHRGLHGKGVPENSMAAFLCAEEMGYGVELDVHLLKDGNLAIIHDASLKRVANANVFIEDLTAPELVNYRLEGTDETIPIFADVLKALDGKVPLVVELKCERNNYPELCRRACELLDTYSGPYCVESFDPRCVYWLRKNRPDVVRGQLTENYFATPKSKLPWYLKFVLKNQMLNFLTHPDFIAYRFSDRKTFSNTICKRLWGAQLVTWTLKNQREYDTAVHEGWIPIFENFQP